MGLGRRVLIGVVVAACGSFGPASAAPPSVDAAAAALRGGNASNAIVLATQALSDQSLTPRDRARVLVERGLAHETLGERDGALVDFTEAIGAHVLPGPEQARAFYDRGVTLDELSRPEEAVGDYSAALQLDPRYAAAFNNRGNAYRRLGKLDAARADYLQSLAVGNPRPEYPNFGLGQIAEAQGQPDLARDHYRAALAANPEFSLAADRLAALGGPTTVGDSAPVILRAPGRASDSPVQLRPPRSRAARVPPALQIVSVTPPLKPALSEGPASGGTIQLGAWRQEADAARAWKTALAAGGDLLANLSPQVLAVDIEGKGRFYRLRAGPVRGGAAALCGALRARGQACVVVRN